MKATPLTQNASSTTELGGGPTRHPDMGVSLNCSSQEVE